MGLKEARDKIEDCRDRIKELEAQRDRLAEVSKHVLSRARYTHKNRLIKQMEQRAEAKTKELATQRDELLKACKAIMNSSRLKPLSAEVVAQTMEAIEKVEGIR